MPREQYVISIGRKNAQRRHVTRNKRLKKRRRVVLEHQFDEQYNITGKKP